MVTEADTFVEDAYRQSVKLPKKQTIAEWARANIKLDATAPIPGPYRIELTPQLGEPLLAFQDERVRHIVTVGPNQGGRTKGMEMALYWSISNRSGPTQWNSDVDPQAKDFAEERFWPTVNDVPEIVAMFPANHDLKRTQKVIWKNGCPLIMQGSAESGFQQKSILNQFNDEIYKWKQGRLGQAHKRCKVSYAWSHKIWDSSIPGIAGDDLGIEWSHSTQGEWSFCCRKCETVQPFKWGAIDETGGLKFDRNEITKPGGVWNFDVMRKTVRYVCENKNCGEVYKDQSASRREMNESGRYVHLHPTRKTRGFRYNILSVNWPGLSWGDAVEELLKAREQAKLFYNIEPLKIFWTRSMTQWWEEDKFLALESRRRTADYRILDDAGENWYKTNKWDDEEWGRFMGVDKQQDYYRYVIRAVKKEGASRLVHVGKADSYAELDQIAKTFGVIASRVIIDCNYEQYDVYAAAVKYGWTCFRGEDKDGGFTHVVEHPETKKKMVIMRPYSEKKYGDPGGGTKFQQHRRGVVLARMRLATVYHFSNLQIKNSLSALKQGRVHTYWGWPGDVPDYYEEEMGGETRYRITNARGRVTYFWSNAGRDGKAHRKPNHSWDCECMILCAMVMANLITIESQAEVNEIPAAGLEESESDSNGQAA